MRIIRITEENESYFDKAIGKFWWEEPDYFFFGLLDDEDAAVGAAVLEADEDSILIRYFGIMDECRRQGYGRFFMEGLKKRVNPGLFRRLAFFDFEENDKKNEFDEFLLHCGFTGEKNGTCRTFYPIDEILAAEPFGKDSLPKGVSMIRVSDIDEEMKAKVQELSDATIGNTMWLDDAIMLSTQNRYGGFLLKNKEIDAMICANPFRDGVLLEGIYARDSLNELMYLFDYAVEAIRHDNPIPEFLAIDTYGERFIGFEDKIMTKKGIKRTKRLYGYVYEWEVN